MSTRKRATPAKARPLTPRSQQWYGWRRDTPDQRDKLFTPRRRVTRLPQTVDLRTTGFLGPVYDQGQLGSCTGNACAGAFEYETRKQGLSDYVPSRLFIYYGEREIEGTIGSDAGAEIRDGFKVLNHLGAPHETLWPYDIGQFAQKPSPQSYTDAAKHLVTQYARVQTDATAVKKALASGTPVVIGFSVYESFESDKVANTGMVPVPKANEQLLGGHAVLAIGYTHIKRAPYLIVRNSWGLGWGMEGNFMIPLGWITSPANAGDFWTATVVA